MQTTVAEVSADDEHEKPGMSVYEGYIGKTIRRKDGFVGTITDISINGKDAYVVVQITSGNNAGKTTKIQLSFILNNNRLYTISD